MISTSTLKINNLNASWNKSDIVLKNISFEISQGELICLSGPNGSGKSTLLSILAGISNPTLFKNGSIVLDDKEISTFKRKKLSQKIAFMSQYENCLWDFTVQEFILAGRFCHTNFTGIYSLTDKEIVTKVMDQLQISTLKDKSVRSLSGGEFQKVRIARTLCQDSDFILLDEPVANLDFSYQKEILTFLKDTCHNFNKGIIISIHDLNTASLYADKIALLGKNKRFILDTPDNIITESTLKEFYNTDFCVFTHPEFGVKQIYVK